MQLTEKQKLEGWRIVKFGDVAQEVKASTKDPLGEGIERYIGLEHIDPESLRLARYGLIAEDNPTFTKKFSAGDILFGRRRAYLKKAAVADFDGICSGDITVIAPKGEDLVPDLLPFIVQSEPFFDWAVKHSAGGLSPRTKFKSLAEFEFPLPPRPRQEEMLEVFEKIEDNLLFNLRTFEILNKLTLSLTREIEENKYYENYELQDISKIKKGTTITKKQVREGNVPVIAGGQSPAYFHNQSNREPEVITVSASGAYAGFVNYFSIPIFASDCSTIESNDKNLLNIKFLYFLLKSKQNYLYSLQIGGGQPHVYPRHLEKIKIPLPSKDEQQKILNVLELIEGQKENIKTSVKSLIGVRNKYLKNILEEAA